MDVVLRYRENQCCMQLGATSQTAMRHGGVSSLHRWAQQINYLTNLMNGLEHVDDVCLCGNSSKLYMLYVHVVPFVIDYTIYCLKLDLNLGDKQGYKLHLHFIWWNKYTILDSHVKQPNRFPKFKILGAPECFADKQSHAIESLTLIYTGWSQEIKLSHGDINNTVQEIDGRSYIQRSLWCVKSAHCSLLQALTVKKIFLVHNEKTQADLSLCPMHTMITKCRIPFYFQHHCDGISFNLWYGGNTFGG